MSQKHIVFLDMNKTMSGVEYLKAAKNLGLYITFATFDPMYYVKQGETIETSILGQVDHIITVDTHHDMDALVHTLDEYARSHPIDGILASLDLEILQAAIVSERLGVRGTAPTAVEICRNKYVMRQKLETYNIPTPRFRLVDTLEEAQQAGEDLGYPCVLKPVDLTGSEWVQLVQQPSDFIEPLQQHKANLMYWRGVQKFPKMLIEEFMEGPLISVETVSDGEQVHVLGVTDRRLSEPPYFAELYASFPAQMPGVEAAIEMTVQTLKTIGYHFGPAHTELILTKDGPRIVEINPRLVGATVSLIMNQALGYSVHEEILKLYVGLPSRFDVSYRGVGIWQQFVAAKAGVIQQVTGIEAATQVPGLMELSMEKQVGDRVIAKLQRNMDGVGHFTVFGASREEAVQRANEVLSCLQITVEETEELDHV